MKLKSLIIALAIATTFALVLPASMRTAVAQSAEPEQLPLLTINDTGVKSVKVKVGTVIKVCLTEDLANSQHWKVTGHDGTAVSYQGTGRQTSPSDFDSRMVGCPSLATFAAVFHAREEGQGTIHLERWDHNVPTGSQVPVTYWDVQVDVTP